jgi:hypothetical protein
MKGNFRAEKNPGRAFILEGEFFMRYLLKEEDPTLLSSFKVILQKNPCYAFILWGVLYNLPPDAYRSQER